MTEQHSTGASPAAGLGAALQRALDVVARAATIFSSVCLIVIIASFGWLVYGRYVLNDTPTWAESLSLLLIVYIAFLSAAVGVRENTHLSVSLVVDLLPPRAQRWMRTLADLCLIFFGLVLVIYGWDLAMRQATTRIPLLNLPEAWRVLPGLERGFTEAWRVAPVVIGGGLLTVFAFIRALRRVLFGIEDAEPPHDEPPAPDRSSLEHVRS